MMRCFLLLVLSAEAFRGPSMRPVSSRLVLRMTTSIAEAPPRSVQDNGLYVRERYVSTHRYLVDRDDEINFEHAWASKKTNMGEAPGFRYFQMSKRAADFMGPPLGDEEPNYMSYSVWDSKEEFEAFSRTATTDVIPVEGQPANYDGIFALSLPPSETFETENGWRKLGDPDKGKRLSREAFVASNRFGIKPGFEKHFEDMWAKRDSSLADLPGFKNFVLLRREGPVDDGNTYVSYTTWKDVQSFNNWRGSDNFKRSHSNNGGGNQESPYNKMPKVVTWKCFLVLSCEDGA